MASAGISDRDFIQPIDEAMASGDYIVRSVTMLGLSQAEICLERRAIFDLPVVRVPASVGRYVQGRYLR